MQNPVTGEECESEKDFVESLYRTWRELQADKERLKTIEKKLTDAMQSLVGNQERVQGETVDLVLKRRFNASYPRARGAVHPLREVVQMFGDELSDMIRVEYKEVGNAVTQFLADHPRADLAVELEKIRKVTEGKPSVDFKPRT